MEATNIFRFWRRRKRGATYKPSEHRRLLPRQRAVMLRLARMAVLTTVLLLPSLAVAGAPDYVIAGAGDTVGVMRGSSFWENQTGLGLPTINELDTNVWQIGAGWHIRPWLDNEIIFHDFGRSSLSGQFLEGVEDTAWVGFGYGKTRGVSFTTLPTWHINKSHAIYGRIGFLIYDHKWEEYWNQVQGPGLTPFPKPFLRHGNKGNATDLGEVLGLGWRWNNFTIDATHYYDVGSDSSGIKGLRTLTVNWSFPL